MQYQSLDAILSDNSFPLNFTMSLTPRASLVKNNAMSSMVANSHFIYYPRKIWQVLSVVKTLTRSKSARQKCMDRSAR